MCGRSRLYAIRHCSILHRASLRETKTCSLKHSSRSGALKLSMYAFWIGLPGLIIADGRHDHKPIGSRTWPRSSGPLSA